MRAATRTAAELPGPRSRLWLTAVHEAGHALATIRMGGTFTTATVRRSGFTSGCVSGVRGLSDYGSAVVTAAGPVAESMFGARKPGSAARARLMAGAFHDLNVLVDFEAGGVDVDRARREAVRLVRAESDLVEAVAVMLVLPKPLRALPFRAIHDLVEDGGAVV